MFTTGSFAPTDNGGGVTTTVRVKTVFIQQASGEGGAAWFDNVSLNNLTAAPEPSSAALLGLAALGLAALGLVARRRRK